MDPALIDPDPQQPRRVFDPAGLRSLMASIAEVGVIEPLVVRPAAHGRYWLVAGERRWRAVRLGAQEHPENHFFQQVPVRMWEGSLGDLERIRMQLDENREREDLTPGEMAGAYRVAKLTLEVREAERYLDALHALPADYDHGARQDERCKVLSRALRGRRVPWPDVPWSDVFAALGQPADRRVFAILRVADEVLARCDALGLSKSATATLSELPDRQCQMDVLDVVEQAGDAALATPVVTQLLADPALGAAGALSMVLAARRAVRAAQGGGVAATNQRTLEKMPCPPAEFERVVGTLRDAQGLLATYTMSEYQAGSIRLLIERLLAAVGGRG